ncbi:recombinase family protein [Methanomicrobium sp. W14]|uniref:recombinase family protein n=1 Tax=Methanomicrobium sp. W14 TaxID=2817839 RepID=UPI003741EC73
MSGNRFDRPGFTAMIEEVKVGHVDAVIFNDISRLGRDYLKTGQIMEILRHKNVRLIALNGGVASKGGDDFISLHRRNMKRQKIEAKKAPLRAEYVAKGVFVPAGVLPKAEPRKHVSTATASNRPLLHSV